MFLTGKLKIFGHLREVLDEFNQYHRDEKGRIVKTFDDLLDAVRYAYMMRRFAKARAELHAPATVRIPRPLKSMGR